MHRLHDFTPSRSVLFSWLALFAIMAVALAACGSQYGGSGSPGATTTPTVQKCGSVHSLPDGKLATPMAAKTAEDCFWQAYQQCKAATISYTAGGVDTVSINTFTIKNDNGKCAVSDAAQFSIAPNKPGAPKTYSCSGITQQQNGLRITSCGERGDIVLPAPTGM